jgi:hypothetical protein
MELQLHPSELYVNSETVREWFPESVKSSFVRDVANPDYLRLAADRYEPELFSLPPLLGGHIFIVDDLLVVQLHTL